MVQANELRIGNWLSVGNGEIQSTVEVISFDNIKLTGNAIFNRLEQLYPIPITEDILLKCSFVHPKNDGSILWVHEGDLNSYKFNLRATFRFAFLAGDDKLTVSIGDDSYGVLFARISFLHELQNLFYNCNFKEELKFNPL